jgi:hypothetical protein
MKMNKYWASALAALWVSTSLGMLWHAEALAALHGILCAAGGGHS